jgi:hypothetical protein
MTNLDGQYPPVTLGLVACARCAAVLVNAAEPRRAHDRFHDGLRLLWERTGGPRHNGAGGGSDPAPRRPTQESASRRRHERS